MVLNRLLSLLYQLIAFKGKPRIKLASHASSDVIDPVPRPKLDQSESAAESSSGDSELCCVCLSRLEKEKYRTSLLPCRHRFHTECVERWFSTCKRTCPICRLQMGEEKSDITCELLTEEIAIYFSSFHAAGF